MPVFKRRKPDDPSGPGNPDLEPGFGSPGFGRPGAERLGDASAESGLGVPPFRPAGRPLPTAPAAGTVPASKEIPMARSPFAAPAPLPAAGPQAGQAAAGPGSRPGPLVAAAPGMSPGMARAPEPAERRTLIVGRGISVQGTVQDAERLVVEGTVEASMIHAAELSVAAGGVFRGEAEVEDAEVAGTIDGTLTVRGNLVVRTTGRVLGTARCRRLQVEDGGQITGRMEMISEQAARDLTREGGRAAEPAAATLVAAPAVRTPAEVGE